MREQLEPMKVQFLAGHRKRAKSLRTPWRQTHMRPKNVAAPCFRELGLEVGI